MIKKNNILILGDALSIFSFIDTNKYNYSLITSEYELSMLDKNMLNTFKGIKTVKTSSNFDANCFEDKLSKIISLAKELIQQVGTFDAVVSTQEHTVLVAGKLRNEFGINGTKSKTALNLRDKVAMKETLKKLGNILFPDFIDCSSVEMLDIQNFINKYETVVIKPKSQAGSKGVVFVNNFTDALEYYSKEEILNTDLEMEEFIDSEIWHFDGLVQNGEIKFLSVSKYGGTCYEFVINKKVMTTTIINDQFKIKEAEQFMIGILESLEYENGVFHTEAFRKKDEFIFLEIAGRPAGAGISEHIMKVFSIDLKKEAYNIDIGIKLSLQTTGSLDEKHRNAFGMILIPPPIHANFRIDGYSGLENLDYTFYDSQLCAPGSTFEYSKIEVFKPVVRLYAKDKNMVKIESVFNDINKNLSINYKECK